MAEIIVTCDCGQKNRLPSYPLPAGKVVVCGACKLELDLEALADDGVVDVDDDADGAL